MDLSNYRLVSLSELDQFKEQMGEKEFYDYVIGIWEYLVNMESGDEFDVTRKVAVHNREKFIKIACLYIAEYGKVQFNETFTKIKKI